MESLPEPWLDLRTGDETSRRVRSSVEAELARELLPAHPLAGTDPVAIAKCGHCDDVIFRLGRATFVSVHLTWASQRELPPLPMTRLHSDFRAAVAEMAQHGDGGLR